MFRVQIDSVNKKAEFSVKQNMAGVTFDINKTVEGTVSAVTDSEFGSDVKVKVQLIRKNQPNAVLADAVYNDYKEVLKTIYKKHSGKCLFFALKDNLSLSEDAHLLVTLDWSATPITEIIVHENRQLATTNRPLTIKKEAIAEESEVDSEFYNMLVFTDTVERIESVISVVGDGGDVTNAKQEQHFDYMKSLSDSENSYVALGTQSNQKVKFFAVGSSADIYKVSF